MKTACVTKTKSKKLTKADKTPGGKVGGISKAPKTAIPKAKMGMSMTKKMGMGGMHMMPDGSMMPDAAMTPPMKKGGKVATKKYLTGGPTGANAGGPKQPKDKEQPKEAKAYVKGMKTAKYGTAMMRKGGATKKK